MNSDLLIHIGYHKTGTSWLQSHLFVDSNQHFVNLSRGDSKHSSIAELFFKKGKSLLSPFEDISMEVFEEMENIKSLPQKEFKDRVAVISHERLSGNPHASGFDASLIADRLHQCFPNAKILIVIRNQRDVLLSNYIQYLKKGGILSLKQYLNNEYDGKSPGFSMNHFDYWPLIQYYHKLFGQKALLVLPYESFKETPEHFVREVFSFLEIQQSTFSLSFNEKKNKSQHLLATYMLRFFNLIAYKSSTNGFSPLASRMGYYLMKYSRKCLGFIVPVSVERKFIRSMKRIIKESINERYELSNKKIDEHYNLGLSRFEYY